MSKKDELIWKNEIGIKYCVDIPNLDKLLKELKKEIDRLGKEIGEIANEALATTENYIDMVLQSPGQILESAKSFSKWLPDAISGIGNRAADFIDSITPDITIGTPRLFMDNGVFGKDGCVVTELGIRLKKDSITFKAAIKTLEKRIKEYEKASKTTYPIHKGIYTSYAFLAKKAKIKLEKEANKIGKKHKAIISKHDKLNKEYRPHLDFYNKVQSEQKSSKNSICIDATAKVELYRNSKKIYAIVAVLGKDKQYDILNTCYYITTYYIFKVYFCLGDFEIKGKTLKKLKIYLQVRYPFPSIGTNGIKYFEKSTNGPKLLVDLSNK